MPSSPPKERLPKTTLVFDSSKTPGEILDLLIVNSDVLKSNPKLGKALGGAWYDTMALMQGKGQVEPDEDVLEDGIAFAGVAKFPARVKCALLAWMAWKDATTRVLEEKS